VRFLGVLARHVDTLAVLVVVARRPEPPSALAELAADPQTEILRIRPYLFGGCTGSPGSASERDNGRLSFTPAPSRT
jgi:hypothetical protein